MHYCTFLVCKSHLVTVGKNKQAMPCGVWDCHMCVGSTGLFARVVVTCKNVY